MPDSCGFSERTLSNYGPISVFICECDPTESQWTRLHALFPQPAVQMFSLCSTVLKLVLESLFDNLTTTTVKWNDPVFGLIMLVTGEISNHCLHSALNTAVEKKKKKKQTSEVFAFYQLDTIVKRTFAPHVGHTGVKWLVCMHDSNNVNGLMAGGNCWFVCMQSNSFWFTDRTQPN